MQSLLFFFLKTYILLIFTKISWITWEEKGLKYISNWIYIEKDIWAKSYVESPAHVSESEKTKILLLYLENIKLKCYVQKDIVSDLNKNIMKSIYDILKKCYKKATFTKIQSPRTISKQVHQREFSNLCFPCFYSNIYIVYIFSF